MLMDVLVGQGEVALQGFHQAIERGALPGRGLVPLSGCRVIARDDFDTETVGIGWIAFGIWAAGFDPAHGPHRGASPLDLPIAGRDELTLVFRRDRALDLTPGADRTHMPCLAVDADRLVDRAVPVDQEMRAGSCLTRSPGRQGPGRGTRVSAMQDDGVDLRHGRVADGSDRRPGDTGIGQVSVPIDRDVSGERPQYVGSRVLGGCERRTEGQSRGIAAVRVVAAAGHRKQARALGVWPTRHDAADIVGRHVRLLCTQVRIQCSGQAFGLRRIPAAERLDSCAQTCVHFMIGMQGIRRQSNVAWAGHVKVLARGQISRGHSAYFVPKIVK